VKQLSASFVLALVAACGLAAVAAEPTVVAAPKLDPDPARFTADIAAFEAWDRQNSTSKNAVLFVGSSSIRLWPTAEAFPELAVINRGFGGSHASDVLHFAPRIVIKYEPRTIVFYAGDNDLADGKSPQQVAGDFEKFAELVREKLPMSEIVYLPIKPSLARWKLWPKAQATNELVKKFVADRGYITYLDTATPMLGAGGRPRPEIFLDDGLHMNERGYQLWNELLARHLSQ
jgi:lysophospholipase L1-like esterase